MPALSAVLAGPFLGAGRGCIGRREGELQSRDATSAAEAVFGYRYPEKRGSMAKTDRIILGSRGSVFGAMLWIAA